MGRRELAVGLGRARPTLTGCRCWTGPGRYWTGPGCWTGPQAGRRTYSTQKTKKSTRLEREGETEEEGCGSEAVATGRGDSRLREVFDGLLGRLS
ncbi:hypothetical protein CRG98_001512 [Punica granatum]|uniref:Uncharacterized protein n=1 Tax=Punica granatum TaxID=22663 RepID=A0A2I0LBK5_PUNGR|nr:hypothetical protein CRG98_001512 [Punica granatum]